MSGRSCVYLAFASVGWFLTAWGFDASFTEAIQLGISVWQTGMFLGSLRDSRGLA